MQLNELLIETLKAKQVKSDAVSALERERKEMKIETERLENIVESAEAEVLKNELALITRNYENLSRRHDGLMKAFKSAENETRQQVRELTGELRQNEEKYE